MRKALKAIEYAGCSCKKDSMAISYRSLQILQSSSCISGRPMWRLCSQGTSTPLFRSTSCLCYPYFGWSRYRLCGKWLNGAEYTCDSRFSRKPCGGILSDRSFCAWQSHHIYFWRLVSFVPVLYLALLAIWLTLIATGFHKTTQYGTTYAIGRNCRFLQGPATNKDCTLRLAKTVSLWQETNEVLLN